MKSTISMAVKPDSNCLSEDVEPPGCRLNVNDQAGRGMTLSFIDNISSIKPHFKPKEIIQKSDPYFFLKYHFPKATMTDWTDWKWQLRNRITDLEHLGNIIKLSQDEEKALKGPNGPLPMALTPYYTSLLEGSDPFYPLRRSVVPTIAEHVYSPYEKTDPLKEDAHSPVPCIVHRYPDRALFLVTNFCSTYCRYCTRSRIVGKNLQSPYDIAQWERAIAYIKSHTNIRDVLLSGGDPLTLPDEPLEWLLMELRQISHVELLRIGTKVPVVLPQRITPSLTQMLKRYHPLWLSIHFIHPDELTPEAKQACNSLADAGIPLGSQTVLLSGINNSVEIMRQLVHGLLKCRVRPYYLYQCDPVIGTSHFRTPVEKGLEIIKGLRGHTSGYAIPTYVIDAPGGGGKIPLSPDYVIGKDQEYLFLKNYEDNCYQYPDPIIN